MVRSDYGSTTPRHLVLVRHGESEGDVRRKQKLPALKHPIHEEQTKVGHEQSRAAGSWITKHILGGVWLKWIQQISSLSSYQDKAIC